MDGMVDGSFISSPRWSFFLMKSLPRQVDTDRLELGRRKLGRDCGEFRRWGKKKRLKNYCAWKSWETVEIIWESWTRGGRNFESNVFWRRIGGKHREEYLYGKKNICFDTVHTEDLCIRRAEIKFPLLIDTIHDQIHQTTSFLSNLLEITLKQKTWDNF